MRYGQEISLHFSRDGDSLRTMPAQTYRDLLRKACDLVQEEHARRTGKKMTTEALADLCGINRQTFKNGTTGSGASYLSLRLLVKFLDGVADLGVVSLDLRDEIVWEGLKKRVSQDPHARMAVESLGSAWGDPESKSWRMKRRNYVDAVIQTTRDEPDAK